MTMNAPGLPARTEYRPVDATAALDGVTLNKDALKHAFYSNLFYVQGKIPALATSHDYYLALAYTVRDRMLHRWISTAEAYTKQGSRTVAYLSAEFLMGPHLGNNLLNLGIYEEVVRQAIDRAGARLRRAARARGRAGPGQRRPRPPRRLLPRFAGDARDSVDRLRHPLRVRHLPAGDRRRLAGREDRQMAALRQSVGDRAPGVGRRGQARRPHRALQRRARPASACAGCRERIVNGVPYDTPILGYHVNTANTLRLWRAEATESFDFAVFNRGDYYGAVNQKVVVGEPHQGPLSERRGACRARSCGSSSSTSSSAARCRTCCASCAMQSIPLRALPREVRGAAERHASGDRDRRADAAAGR